MNDAVDATNVHALLTRDYAGLRLLLIRRTRDEALAADLLNDAVCTTLEKWQAGQIAQPEQICGYVFQVALNLLRNHRRSMGERPELRVDQQGLEQLPGSTVVSDEAQTDNIAARVKGWLQGVGTVRDREILKRFYLDEEDKQSICSDLQLAPDQFDKVLHRARGRLRELLDTAGLRGSDLYSFVLA